MNYIIKQFETDNDVIKEPFHIFLTGGGGVGKSHLTRIIIAWLRCCTAKFMGQDPVQICAPTGTAAKNIKGKTIHSTLLLPIQHGNQPTFLQLSSRSLKKLQLQFAHVHTMIIDEISMVSSKMFEHIHRRLCSIKDNDKLFGGLNMIVVGDFLQLRPVRGFYVFENKYLWSAFKPFFLQENVRQSDDSSFANLLNRARVGHLTNENITLLNTRVIPIPEKELQNIIHLYPKTEQVHKHNALIQSLIDKDTILICAKHYFSQQDLNPKGTVSDELIPEDDRNAGGLPNCLRFSVGTRIMLIRNIFTTHGLVNGAMGFVASYELNEENEVNLIYVKFDDPNIGKIFQHATVQDAIGIQSIAQEFYFNGRIIIREQFPLIPAWACTIHKMQGASLNKAAISCGNDIFEKGMAYVALSRVTHLEGLYLLNFNSNKVQPAEKVLIEYARLRENERN